MPVSIREFDNFFAYLNARVKDLGLTNKQLAEDHTPPGVKARSEGWSRKMRNNGALPGPVDLKRLTTVLKIPEEDRTYWLTLHRAAHKDPSEHAEARGYLWTHGQPSLRQVDPSETTEWLMEQPLTTWIVAHLARDPESTAEEMLGGMRCPLSRNDLEAVLTEVRRRDVPTALRTPHLQPRRGAHDLEAHRLGTVAQVNRWGDHKQGQNMTFAAGDEIREQVEAQLGRLVENLKALASEEVGPVILATLSLTPLSGPAAAAPQSTATETSASQPPSLPADMLPSWENPTGVPWEDVVRARIDELGLNMSDLGKRVGKSKSWVSRVVGYRISVHDGDPQTLINLTDALRYRSDDERLEFSQLAYFIHPNPKTRMDAAAFLDQKMRTGGLSVLASVAPAPPRHSHWFDLVLEELAGLEALPKDPLEVAQLVQPPISREQAIDAIRRLRGTPPGLNVHPEQEIDAPGGKDALLSKLQWQDTLERAWAHAEEPTFARTVVVPIAPEQFALARSLVHKALQEVADLLTPVSTAPTVRAYHLCTSLLEVAA